MKGQSELVVLILLVGLGLVILTLSLMWGWNIFQQNMDMIKVTTAENFMRKLNDKILNLI